jgi:hypothetical protein
MHFTTILSFLVTWIFINGCSSPRKKQALTGSDVVRMINHYETDSLQSIMDTVFIMDFDYISFQGNAKTFIGEIMPSSKALEAYYEIIETKKPDNGRFQFIVKDRSAFEKYLDMEPPTMLLTIVINDSNRFEKMFVDSMPGYKQFDKELAKKFKSFDEWLKQKYPDEMLQYLLQDQEGKMIERLKEYSKQ